MISEARLLIRTRKAGLSVPSVWDLDYEGGQLIIEHLGGRPLIEVLLSLIHISEPTRLV